MKRMLRLVALVGLTSLFVPGFVWAQEEDFSEAAVVELKGARLGYTSDTDIVFDIPKEMTCEDLLTLTNGFYRRWLRPYEREPFTVAQRRLLLICCYVNLCHWGALWTGLVCKYEQDTKEFEYGCGPNVEEVTGYLVDRDKFFRIRHAFHMRDFAQTEDYRQYVRRVDEILFSEMFKDRETGRSIPTNADKTIFSKVLGDTAWNRSTDLRFLENKFDQEALGWKDRLFLLRNDSFGKWWLDLRRRYQEMNEMLNAYANTFTKQAEAQYEELETDRIAQQLAREWQRTIDDCRVRLHRCVYDAPYCLLTTNFCRLLEPASGMFRLEAQKIKIKLFFGNFRDRIKDSDDVMTNLSANLSIVQTGRLIALLKDKLGTTEYEALKAQSKLLKEMETVANPGQDSE